LQGSNNVNDTGMNAMGVQMRAARLHEPGKPMQIDRVDRPQPRPTDVLVQVKACGVIPNMNAIFSGRYWHHLPPLPAIVGLDAAGVVAEVGADVSNVAVGERVYVNPWLSCGACHYCRYETPLLCSSAAFQGYFGFFPHSMRLIEAYPYGGFGEYMTAAPDRLVKLPQGVTFDHAARFGYLGTSFSALRFGGVGAGSWVGINGITGTLGVGATLLALAMGATRILGFGRNREVLAQVKALAPARIDTIALGDAPLTDWLRSRTDGLGVDVLLDCSGRGGLAATSLDAVEGLKRGGVAINVGALAEPLPLNATRFMTSRLQYRGSNWFTTGEAQLMAEMVGVGVFDLSKIVTRAFPLEGVNDALACIRERPGGFVNVVVNPDR
jgi:alcohol dehydrogenase